MSTLTPGTKAIQASKTNERLSVDDAHDWKKCEQLDRIYREAYDEFAGPVGYRHAVNFDTYKRAGLIAVWNAAQDAMRSSSETCEQHSQAATDVLAERRRQVSIEGWTQGHDDSHTRGTLAKAAAAYTWSAIYEWGDGFIGPRADAYHASRHWGWPWNADWWKPKGPRSDLVRAGALIIAEIERLDRSSSEKANSGDSFPEKE